MQYCSKCKVTVNGNKKCCPLCQNDLKLISNDFDDTFPITEVPEKDNNIFLRVMSFIAIAVSVICIAINMMVPSKAWWSLFVIAGIACTWITIAVGYYKKSHIFKNITWQLFIISILSIVWDIFTGWHRWSIDYVLPCSCLASMASMLVTARMMKVPTREYLVYLILDGIYGIIPIIFILTKQLTVIYPSVICVACSILQITAVLLFAGKEIKEEITKKFHI